ncbi:hypothetical protein OESDEN_15888 [Oesophagostomum dentatum]|uniref:Uncharacterized protein n=1 Tax=Oesophagostomum dentatum TaxID=61180 RepID=A0A0B1SME8_OESDE|nr:hypothetical protein OESDEN_15888 [Oesophagostomum dentatum]
MIPLEPKWPVRIVAVSLQGANLSSIVGERGVALDIPIDYKDDELEEKANSILQAILSGL